MCVLNCDHVHGYFAMFQMTYICEGSIVQSTRMFACMRLICGYVYSRYVIMFTCICLDHNNIIICNFL